MVRIISRDNKKQVEVYITKVLKALGISLETTGAILAFLSGDEEAQMELMDWLEEHYEEGLTESQILFAVRHLLP